MKPHALITRPVSTAAIELLTSVCDTLPRVAMNRPHQSNFRLIAECTDALLLCTTEHVDDALLSEFPRLRVVACTFRDAKVVSRSPLVGLPVGLMPMDGLVVIEMPGPAKYGPPT